MATYKVLRQHYGEKAYAAGDTREAEPREVAHLVASGVLAEVVEKAAPKLANKAAPKVSNKSDAVK